MHHNVMRKELRLLQFLVKRPCPITKPKREKSDSVNDHELFNSYQYKDMSLIAQDLTSKQNYSQDLVKEEEYTLEYLNNSKKCARLVIFWKPFDDTFYGTLLNDKTSDCKAPE